MSSDELERLYKIRFNDKELTRKNAIWKILCDSFFSKFIKSTDAVIDIGCGSGEFINNISAHKRMALDLNSNAKAYLHSDITLHIGHHTQLNIISNGSADAVFTSNFLEHLPDKTVLDDLLDKILIALKPGGKYLILGPNLRYLPGEYWDFYDHHLGLTHLSLCEALQLRGFNIDVCIDKFLPYTTKGKLPTHPWLVWLYLQFPLAWRILGKQFFIVASKP